MIKIVGIRWVTWSIMLGLSMSQAPALAAATDASTPATAYCFRHVGPQDKPMPAFCVLAPGSEHGAGAMHAVPGTTDVLASTPDAWHDLTLLIASHGQRSRVSPSAFGAYAVRAMPSGQDVVLPPDVMRKVVTALDDMPTLDRAQADMLARLRRRLAPS